METITQIELNKRFRDLFGPGTMRDFTGDMDAAMSLRSRMSVRQLHVFSEALERVVATNHASSIAKWGSFVPSNTVAAWVAWGLATPCDIATAGYEALTGNRVEVIR